MRKLIILFIFILGNLGLLAQISSITYPKNDQVINDSIIEFQWDEIIGATNYQLQIANDSLFQNIIYDTITINHNLSLNLNLSFNTKYTRYKSDNKIAFSLINKFYCFNPKSIDSLVLWLAADTGVVKDVNGKVSQWKDMSGNGNNASQSGLTLQPSFQDSIIGKYPSISFVGGNYIISGSYNQIKPNNKNRSLILLLNNDYVSGYNNAFVNFVQNKSSYKYLELSYYPTRVRCWLGDGNSFKLKSLGGVYLGLKTSSFIIDDLSIFAYNNSVLGSQSLSTLYFDSLSKFAIGGRTSNGSNISAPFNGQVFEIIDYAKPLDSTQTQLINKYLLDKYTPPINLGQNILRTYGFCDTTLKTEAIYESYTWNTGATTREISITKEDTGWYWCEVPNLYGELMRDSVYVYNLLPKQDIGDTLVCYGDTLKLTSVYSDIEYNHYWINNQTNDTLSTSKHLNLLTFQPFILSLKIEDSFGCYITDSFSVSVDSFPIQASLGTDKSICSGEQIGLISGQAQADTFLWNTGDIDSLIIVNTAGSYSLRTANGIGCIANDTIEIIIHGISPLVNFSADTVCFNDSTLFIDASQAQDASNLINWIWDFNDGTQPLNLSTFQPFNHLLPDSGTYNIKLTVSTDSNCSNYTYKNIYIRPLPQANFITANTCENHNTEFINTTIITHAAISSYKWVFYDNNGPKDTLNTENPIYYYSSINNNRVDLFATSINNCVDSISKTINIKESPIAAFSFTDVCDGDSVIFNDLSSSSISNPIINRQWIFNEADTSNLINPKHLFDSADVYNTSLRIISQNTCWDSISRMVKVNAVPKADFISDSSCLNAITGFYDQSFVQDDTIKAYYWNFNAYGSSNVENPEVRYTDTNVQEISLKVISGMNCIDSITKLIKTHNNPKADFSFDKEYGAHPFEVQFDNKSQNAFTYNWNFDDATNSTLINPQHTFADSLIYDVKLVSINEFTCSDSAINPIYGIYIPNDIAIMSAPIIEKNDTLNFYCNIINNGQQRIRDLKLELSYNDTLDIIEYWQGELLPGNTFTYNFNSKITNYRIDTINTYILKITAFNNTEEYDTINNKITNTFHINALSDTINPIDLIYPKDKQTISDNKVKFHWNLRPQSWLLSGAEAQPNALTYNLQYSPDSLFPNPTNILNLTKGSYLSKDLELGEKYYWKVRSITDTIYSDWSEIWQFNCFNPKSIDSLVLWLAADTGVVKDENGKVSQWNDMSGYGNDASQSLLTLQPSFQDSAIGLHPSISYLGGSYSLSGSYSLIKPNNKNRSLVLLVDNQYISGLNNVFCNFENGVSSHKLWETSMLSSRIRLWIGDGSTYLLPSFYGNYSGIKISMLNVNNSVFDSYINNDFKKQNTISLSVDSVSNYAISGRTSNGTSISNPFNGQVFEIIDYAKPLDSIQIQLVNNYLKDKYTPPINLGADLVRTYGFCDTTLKTEAIYESYIWNTGDTVRQISIAKEDTGWYWCDVPNLYGEIMRDSVYVYDLVGKPNLLDTIICYGDSSSVGVPFSLQSSVFSLQSSVLSLQSSVYTYEWKNSLRELVSTNSILKTTLEDTYSLKISDFQGCFIADTVHVRVDSFQLIASLGSDLSLCTGNKIGLVNGQVEADSFLWSTGSSDSLLEIFTAGTYSLIVRDTLNCVAKDTILIDIHGVTPMVSFSADTVCYKDSSLFIDASQSLDASNLIVWEWDFNDGSSPTHQFTNSPFSHLLPDSGTYKVKLTVSTDSNCTNFIYQDIYIRPLPQPDFYPLTACENHDITFENLTIHKDSLISSYWDFGNGDTAIQFTLSGVEGITYIYNLAGTYNTILKSTDIYGCTDSIIKTVNIKPSPKANFNNSVSCEGDDISFADNSTTLSYNPIQAWQWIFDTTLAQSGVEGSTSPSPIHHYDTAGFYPVNLKVISINQCWDTITKMVQIHAIPEANFSNDTACINSPVNFTEYSTIEDGSINYYYWLQDGIAFSADQNSSFIFGDTLEHNVVLKVRTTALCEDSISRIIKVHPLPNAAFTTDRVYGLPPLTVGFINQSSSSSTLALSGVEGSTSTSTLTYEWYFGDGGSSYDEDPLHTYTDSAIFYPKLYAFNKFGCLDSAFGAIYAVYSAVDVSVDQIKAEIKNGYISYSCRITNLGKQKLTELELSAKYNSGLGTSEQWQGELHTGESMDYVFSSRTQIPRGDQIQYFCIEVQVTQMTDQEDENPDNNSVCEDISTNFWVSTAYPNPATNEINIDIILPYSQNMEIELIDLSGKVLRSSSLNGQKGLNKIKLPVHNLPSAKYNIQIITNEGREVRGFIK